MEKVCGVCDIIKLIITLCFHYYSSIIIFIQKFKHYKLLIEYLGFHCPKIAKSVTSVISRSQQVISSCKWTGWLIQTTTMFSIFFLVLFLGGQAANINPKDPAEYMPNYRAQSQGHNFPSRNDTTKFDQLVQTLREVELHYEVHKLSVGTLIYSVGELQEALFTLIDSITRNLDLIETACNGNYKTCKFSEIYAAKMKHDLKKQSTPHIRPIYLALYVIDKR